LTEKEFKNFYDQNFDRIRSYLFYRSGNQELATDLAQEAFIKIWEKNIAFMGKKTSGLAYKIASDLFVSYYRHSKSEMNYLNNISFEFNQITPEEEMQFKELKNKFEETLCAMNENQRVVFLMSRFEGLKYAEIADKLSLSVKAVEKRMSGALSVLQKALLVVLYLLGFFNLIMWATVDINNSSRNFI